MGKTEKGQAGKGQELSQQSGKGDDNDDGIALPWRRTMQAADGGEEVDSKTPTAIAACLRRRLLSPGGDSPLPITTQFQRSPHQQRATIGSLEGFLPLYTPKLDTGHLRVVFVVHAPISRPSDDASRIVFNLSSLLFAKACRRWAIAPCHLIASAALFLSSSTGSSAATRLAGLKRAFLASYSAGTLQSNSSIPTSGLWRLDQGKTTPHCNLLAWCLGLISRAPLT
ncbi:hypothetical protein NM208_g17046 [Fusarium decemcellulare]|uniref:Uncharacterized protein n=1 Tax=Fusarium decemcellulare TaxID=57161 RepID=A0ACC1RAC5_9HYPO|nr:hypothetical protein NM208_g17046 [Fusarium decemcellulare]